MDRGNQLELDRCPHCQVHRPRLIARQQIDTDAHSGGNNRRWRFYECSTCGGVVTAAARLDQSAAVIEYYPRSQSVDDAVPERARSFLSQAIESLHAPAGAVMLCASSVDAMLKQKNYKDGSLYSRIDAAVREHAITPEMAAWAHEVRLDANDQRHADEAIALPSQPDAQRCIDFTRALGDFLFVLPARVARGRKIPT